ncbi:phosphotransferase [Streptomyces sp. WAC06614]|uniref:aminoglycoside phosphotransferase family protein n=1 Tax=Streptomyces sp. WAC06614 TaxID=2487416 RepID=UPI000F7B73BA|nr:aminoglycoside 3'-phosphotransferase/choline kinase family protein [Streptomyces sp. WAC06614]RSS84075.1 aminoglycoside phosphotransferase family protein [Streptomyces sp. WAC06614]
MLPAVVSDEDGDAVVPDEAVLRVGAEGICGRLGLGGVPLVRFEAGSVPVYAVGEGHVLKLFPATSAEDAVTEGRVLGYLQGRLPVPTPRLYACGPCGNGWQYVLMSRLRGDGLAEVWERLPQAGREGIVTEVGEALAALHALDATPLDGLLGPGDWGAFLDRQRGGAVARQRERGLGEGWLEQIPEFLDSVALPRDPARVLLHTEVMREHLLVEPDGRRLSGLFDFEPAMIGDPAYDFVAVGLFVTRGDPRLMGRLSAAYGRRFDPELLLAYTLLHVYSNLPWYMRELGTPADGTLASLARAWFGTQ